MPDAVTHMPLDDDNSVRLMTSKHGSAVCVDVRSKIIVMLMEHNELSAFLCMGVRCVCSGVIKAERIFIPVSDARIGGIAMLGFGNVVFSVQHSG